MEALKKSHLRGCGSRGFLLSFCPTMCRGGALRTPKRECLMVCVWVRDYRCLARQPPNEPTPSPSRTQKPSLALSLVQRCRRHRCTIPTDSTPSHFEIAPALSVKALKWITVLGYESGHHRYVWLPSICDIGADSIVPTHLLGTIRYLKQTFSN